MNIKIINKIPFEELVKRVRTVPLLKAKNPDGSKIYIYNNTDISLRTLSPDELNPTTFYLLNKNLQFQRDLRDYLLINNNVDTLSLDHALELENLITNEFWTLMPPVIEVTEEDVEFINTRGDIHYNNVVGTKIPIINDGAHRVYLAKELNTKINVIYINKIPKDHPFYALPNSWDMINLVDSIPKTMEEKKFYRRKNSYSLYRDFSVLGCGAPRKIGI